MSSRPHLAAAALSLTCYKGISRDKSLPNRFEGWTMRDRDVRSALMQKLNIEFSKDPHTRIVEEMGIWSGSVRIDVAVINGELSGFELKSDRDTLERLPLQADLYSRVFDRVTLVVGERHAEQALGIIPEWWGVMVATQNGPEVDLSSSRDANINPDPDPYLVAQLLWKDEALTILDKFDLAKGWRSKRIKEIHRRLSAELEFDELTFQVREKLKKREGWLGQVGSC